MTKKMTLISLVTISLVLFIFTVYKTNQSKNIDITNSIDINAPIDSVFNTLSSLHDFKEWSPYLTIDPSLKTEVKGTDRTVGAQFHWNGNNGKEVGYQEIKNIRLNQSITMECIIKKPFEGTSTFDYTLTQKDGKTVVLQNFRMNSSFISAFFIWITGAKSQMEKTNQLGLNNLNKMISG